jgi:hypothetical protein
MILSSADILRILSGDAIIRQEAKVTVVEGRPGLGVEDAVYIYVDKYPTVDEFEATWNIWVQDNSGMGSYVLNAMTALLPSFDFKGDHYTTTDFASERTVVKTQEEIEREEFRAERVEFKNRLTGMQKGVEDRLRTVRDGRDGKDGRDGLNGLPGKDGKDGRDGKDLVATDADLEDLNNVEVGATLPLDRGQVLMWDGVAWTNRFTRQVSTLFAGSSQSSTVVTGGQGSQISWIYHEETGEPHARKFHSHGETDATLVTELHVSKINAANNDVELLLDAILPITSQIYISDNDDPSQAHLYDLTGYTETTDGFNLAVSHVDTPGPEPSFIANDQYDFLFLTGAGTGGATSIDELTDVDTSTTTPSVGQTLVWDGANWVPGDSTEGIGEAPIDGNFYVRYNGQWINMIEAINLINLLTDGGNFTLGEAETVDRYIYDGGDFINNTSDTGEQVPPAEGYEELDGGEFS